MAQREAAIYRVLAADHPQSVRYVLYRLTEPVIPGGVERTEQGY